MPDWSISSLGAITNENTPVTYGVVKPGPESANGVLFIRGGDILKGRIRLESLRTITKVVSGQYKRTLLRGGEIVVSLVGNPGQVAIVPNELSGANIARQVGLVRLKKGVSKEFVKYYLISPLGQEALTGQSIGSVQQVINLRDLKNVKIRLPSLNEQNAIASILGSLDDKIDLNKRTNETLEEMARAIFKSWFVNFDPVKAKMAGKKPAHMGPETAALFPERFDQETGLPEGWEVKKLGELMSFQKGRKPKLVSNEPSKGFLPHILISAFEGPQKEYAVVEKAVLCEKYDPIMVMDGARSGLLSIGHIGVVGSTLARVSIKTEMLKPFIYFFLKERETEISNNTTGTSIPHTDKNLVLGLEVTVPPKELFETFNQVSKRFLELTWNNIYESQTLAELRDTLLPKLMSGEICIKDAEKEVEKDL